MLASQLGESDDNGPTLFTALGYLTPNFSHVQQNPIAVGAVGFPPHFLATMPLPTIAGRVRSRRKSSSSGKRSARSLRHLKSPVVNRILLKTAAPSSSYGSEVEAALDATTAKTATRPRHITSKRIDNHPAIPTMVTTKSETGKPDVQRLSSSLVNFWGGGAAGPKGPSPTAAGSSTEPRPSPVNTTVSTDGTISSTEHISSSVRKLASRFERKTDASHSTTTSSSSSSCAGSYQTNGTSEDDDDDMASQQRQLHYRERLVSRKRSCHRRLFSPQQEQQQHNVSSSSSEASSGILQSSYWSSSMSSSGGGGSSGSSSIRDVSTSVETSAENTSHSRFSTPESSLLAVARSAVDTPPANAVPVPEDPVVAPADSNNDLCEAPVDASLSRPLDEVNDEAIGEAIDSFEPASAATSEEQASCPVDSVDPVLATDEMVHQDDFQEVNHGDSVLVTDSFSATADEADDERFEGIHQDESNIGDSIMLEDPYELQANKSEYSEGILYNLIHAAQAAVEQDSQEQQCIEVAPAAPAVTKVQDAPSVTMGALGSVIGESSTMTRSGETVLLSNRSDRAVVPAFGNTELPEDRTSPPSSAPSPSGVIDYALADDDDDGIKSSPENHEYMSESSVSGTESATSGDNSDLDNFLGNFMTDFNQEAALSGMRCASTDQVVESEKPTMPSLFEIREYLKKEMNPVSPCTNDDEAMREDQAQFYSKGVLGDHLSDATSQVDSQLDSVTWNTEASDALKQESKPDPAADYAPSQWFDTIQKTLFSMTGTAESPSPSTSDSPAKTNESPNESNASFGKSFDTLDEIMQALQGAPPLTARARKVQQRSLQVKKPDTKMSPTKKQQVLSRIGESSTPPPASKPTFSSTPISPTTRSLAEDSPEKSPDTSRSPENSVMESSTDGSFRPVNVTSNTTDFITPRSEGDRSFGSVTARKQIDEVYSVLHNSRAEKSSDSSLPCDAEQSEKTEMVDEEGEPKNRALQMSGSASPTSVKRSVSKRRAPKIMITTGSSDGGYRKSTARTRTAASSTVARVSPTSAMVYDVPNMDPVPLPASRKNESRSLRVGPTVLDEALARDTTTPGTISPSDDGGENANELSETDLEKSEADLTFLGQEMVLELENDVAEATSVDATEAQTATGAVPWLLQESQNDKFRGFVSEQELPEINDMSTIKNVNSSLTSECSGIEKMTSPPRVSRFVSPETVGETSDVSRRGASPAKVLKRLGSRLFARGGKYNNSSSDSSTPDLNRSTESSAGDVQVYEAIDSLQSGGRPYSSDGGCSAPQYAAIDISSDPSSSGRLDSSGESPSNRKPRQMPMRWLRRSPLTTGGNETRLLDQEDSQSKASRDNERRVDADSVGFTGTGSGWNSQPSVAHVVSPPERVVTNARSLQNFRSQKVAEPITDMESSWEEFTSAEPFRQPSAKTVSSSGGSGNAAWTDFAPQPVTKPQQAVKQLPGPALRSSRKQVSKDVTRHQAPQWEDFSGSAMFSNDKVMYEV